MRPIVRPGTPWWAEAFLSGRWNGRTAPLQVGSVVFGSGLLLGAAALTFAGIPVGPLLFIGPVGAIAAAVSRHRHDVFAPPFWRHKGVPMEGPALDMVEDVQQRFEYAQRLVGQVPTGIDWADIEGDVAVLLWDSVEQAAAVSVLDKEIHELRYADHSSPQGLLVDELKGRRQEHWQMLEAAQREAETLARAAGNAAAAAKVALARTGSLRALEIVAPSGRVLAARGALAEARARLSVLTDAWIELDESGELQARRLGLEPGRDEE